MQVIYGYLAVGAVLAGLFGLFAWAMAQLH